MLQRSKWVVVLFSLSLWTKPCLSASSCEKVASLTASRIAQSETYNQLQELLIRADSETTPGVSDKLTAEFQTKLSEYHSMLVASGEFSGSIDELRREVAKDARKRQVGIQEIGTLSAFSKDLLRRNESAAFFATTWIDTRVHQGRDMVELIPTSEEKRLYLRDSKDRWSFVDITHMDQPLVAVESTSVPQIRKTNSSEVPYIRLILPNMPNTRQFVDFISGGDTHSIKKTDVHGSNLINAAHVSSRYSVAFLGDELGTLSYVNLRDLPELVAKPLPYGDNFGNQPILSMAESPDGNILFVGGENGKVIAINLKVALEGLSNP